MAVRKEIIRTGWSEAGGVLVVVVCVLLALGLLSYQPEDVPILRYPPQSPPANLVGPFGAWTAFVIFATFGVAGYLVLPFLFVWAGFLFFQRVGRVWPKAVGLAAVLVCLAALLDLFPEPWTDVMQRLNLGVAGGWVGEWLASRGLVPLMGRVGSALVIGGVMVAAAIVGFGVRPIAWMLVFGRLLVVLHHKWVAWRLSRKGLREQLAAEAREIEKRRRRLERALKGEEAAADTATREGVMVTRPEPPRAPARLGGAVAGAAQTPGAATPTVEPRGEADLQSAPPGGSAPGHAVVDMAPAAGPKGSRRVAADEPVLQPGSGAGARATGAAGTVPAAAGDPVASVYQLPPLSLLESVPPASQREIQGDLRELGQTLVETLAEFGIDVQLINVEQGPVVTRFEILPGPGVRVERIVSLSNNIALALKAESVRVLAPVPGKGVVGIEVPNIRTTLVYLREVLESDVWRGTPAALPLAIGKDVGGRVIVADLAEMPHLLIAGATGSGKTVCVNAMLMGLLMARTPEQLRLLLVDPKIVEFSAYNHLPHLVAPVITDPKKVALGLRWAINEMERRYKLFARVGVRNIRAYNQRPIERQGELFATRDHGDAQEASEETPMRLPYIVIVIDELADLMLVAQADIENAIARLAQLSRAVGIHMILATQRPSVNVITGTIKANFPARIAFKVAQKVDSRVILDANGADKLLGKGDMLFLPPGTSKMIRAQGCMVSDAEVRAITNFIRAQATAQFDPGLGEKLETKGPELPDVEEDEELVQQAIEVIRQTRRASTSTLQRRLRIGYTRAARIMDLLEQRGIVGPAQGSDPREILVDLDGEIPLRPSAAEDGRGGKA